MAVPPISADEQTVGDGQRCTTPRQHDSAGDPAKVAQAILAVAAMDTRRRLLLGSDALVVATASAAARRPATPPSPS